MAAQRRPADARGSAAVWMMVAVTAVAALGVTQAAQVSAVAARALGAPGPAMRVAEARERVLDWYAGHLAALDAPDAAAPDADTALAAAGLGGRSDLRFAAGPLQRDDRIGWRVMAVWQQPDGPDASGFDPSGVFRPDPRVRHLRVFSSEPLQRAAWAASEERLRALARLAERRFEARVDADPTHAVSANHFRDADGRCRLDGDQLPCTATLAPDGWIDVATFAARTRAFGPPGAGTPDGAPAADASGLPERDAWGGALLVSNDADPAWLQPPFAMAFAARTPWQTVIAVRAVQPR